MSTVWITMRITLVFSLLVGKCYLWEKQMTENNSNNNDNDNK